MPFIPSGIIINETVSPSIYPELDTDIKLPLQTDVRRNRMLETVRQYFIEEDWSAEELTRPDGGSCFAIQFQMPHGLLQVFIDVFGDGDRFAVHAYSSIQVPEQHRIQVAIYTAYANFNMLTSRLELDMENGDLRMTATVDVEDSELSRKMIHIMENIVIIEMNRHMSSILAIIYGNLTAVDAYALYRNGSDD